MPTITEHFAPADLHHGFGKFDDLGVGVNYDLYERNIEKANNENKQPCNHCGRGLNLDTCYLAIYAHGRQRFIAVDVDHDALLSFTEAIPTTHAPTGETVTITRPAWSWVFLGSECAKNLPEAFRLRYRDFDASKWNGTAAHHGTEWGTW